MFLNSDTEIKLRRYKANLATSGAGYILFGIWTVLKIFITTTMDRAFLGDIMSFFTQELMDQYGFLIHAILYSIISFIAFIAFIVHFYVGYSAVSYSRGKKRNKFFLVVTAFLLFLSCLSIHKYFEADFDLTAAHGDSTIVSAVVDLTVGFILFEIMYCTVRLEMLFRSGSKEAEQATPADNKGQV